MKRRTYAARAYQSVALAALVLAGCIPGTQEPPLQDRGQLSLSATAPATAQVGETVALAAQLTGADAGGTATFAWAQIAGPGIAVRSAATADAEFTAPSLAADADLRFAVKRRSTTRSPDRSPAPAATSTPSAARP
jgi:hypothetical protein